MKTKRWIIAVIAGSMLGWGAAWAGSLTPTNAPAPTMHTLEEIYQKVAYIGTNAVSIVVSTNVFASYGSGLPKTGQTVSYNEAGSVVSSNRDDGDLKRGTAWPVPRFTDNTNGTVLDNLTGLIWLKNVGGVAACTWTNALAACATLNTGELGLSDGSAEGDWRLPNVRELHSLVDFGRSGPALPLGHPFTNYVSAPDYWSSTTQNSSKD